jgi:cytochrome c oxidase subunit 4
MLAATRTRVGGAARAAIQRRNASTSNVAVQNIETRWKTLSTAEQNTIAKQLEEAQKGDWKALSLDEKKAACKSSLVDFSIFQSTMIN